MTKDPGAIEKGRRRNSRWHKKRSRIEKHRRLWERSKIKSGKEGRIMRSF